MGFFVASDFSEAGLVDDATLMGCPGVTLRAFFLLVPPAPAPVGVAFEEAFSGVPGLFRLLGTTDGRAPGGAVLAPRARIPGKWIWPGAAAAVGSSGKVS